MTLEARSFLAHRDGLCLEGFFNWLGRGLEQHSRIYHSTLSNVAVVELSCPLGCRFDYSHGRPARKLKLDKENADFA